MLFGRYFIFFWCFLYGMYSCSQVEQERLVKKNSPTDPHRQILHADFVKLKNYFKKDSIIFIDSTLKIPFILVSKFIRDDFDTINNISEVNPFAYFENNFGYFMVVRLGCNSGGSCSIFDLISFNTNGQHDKNQVIGSESGEESRSTFFELVRISDTSIATLRIGYDNNLEKYIDTIRNVVRLTIH
jgi:hypothetical protein